MANEKKKGGFSVYWIYAVAGLAFIAIQLFYNVESHISVQRKNTLFQLIDSNGVAKVEIINGSRADFKLNKKGLEIVKNSKSGEYKNIWKQLKKDSPAKQKERTLELKNIGDLGNFETNLEDRK
ncbi:MAG: peptidase M41, partial [Flavobacteriia bacterium]|nr:peptidase M41 [Flavobacteriia bacterium]